MNKKEKLPKHSGFEAPAIGEVVEIPEGYKRITDKDGISHIVKIDDETVEYRKEK